MSEILNLNSDTWEYIYDKIIIPKLGDKGITNKSKVIAIYDKIRGRWWTRGIKNKLLYSWENWFGKAHYEMKQELKALSIIMKDIDLCKVENNGSSVS